MVFSTSEPPLAIAPELPINRSQLGKRQYDPVWLKSLRIMFCRVTELAIGGIRELGGQPLGNEKSLKKHKLRESGI
jgi:hypothetical protein